MRHRFFTRPTRILAAISVVAAVTLAASPAHASSAVYAALGDSYASGDGANSYDSASGSCYRSSRSYPALWASGHSPAGFSFTACSGAHTSDVLASQLGGLSSSTTLVTLTIGGNDIGFVAVVGTCTLASTSICAGAVSIAETLARTVLATDLKNAYATIKARAPQARLVVLGYPRLFDTSSSSCGLLGVSQANRIRINAGADVLDSVIASSAAAAGATFVDVRGAFSGHGVCGSSPWINGPTLPVQNSYHPNATGYANGYLPGLNAVTG